MRGSTLYSRYGAPAGYVLVAAVIAIGWLGRDQRNIDAGHGLGYALGLAGGLSMLVLLLYPLRKRLRALAAFGATRHWFRAHMMLGVAGPTLILYHCNFQLGDVNSRVALYCTLLVAASGLIGRYLYAGIHHGLYGGKATLQELVSRLQAENGGEVGAVLGAVRGELAALDREMLAPPDSLIAGVLRPLTIGWRTRRLARRLSTSAARELRRQAMNSPALAQHAGRFQDNLDRYLREHLAQVRQVARFSLFERLFSLWHVVHVPFFLLMVLTALFHVFAVHFF